MEQRDENTRYLVLDLYATDFIGQAARKAARVYCDELSPVAPRTIKKLREIVDKSEMEAIKREAMKNEKRKERRNTECQV